MSNEFQLPTDEIAKKAKEIRKKIIRMNSRAGQGHTGADLSETDILATLFFRILNIRKNNLNDPNRDRFILSKGHGVGGFYCTLAEADYIDESLLMTYLQFDSALPGHPVRQKMPCIELNTGALGHGLSVAVGLALSGKMSKRTFRTFVLTGDGELQEGSVWEAAMSATHFKLDNLIVIVDRNTLQLGDRTENIMALEPLADKWKAFGFDVHATDGNNVVKFTETIEGLDMCNSRPHVVIARTIKGKGVSFIEDKAAWHHKIPTGDQIKQAIEELE
ncbi:MAG: transketolase [Planctomycetes bacterium RBG_13_44_8b]|nr:MAG: transketolase [Planctomycetes bacterium RBG_13_44_8b]